MSISNSVAKLGKMPIRVITLAFDPVFRLRYKNKNKNKNHLFLLNQQISEH